MAITTIENFDSLNDGQLTGQNDWVAGNKGTAFTVQTSVVFSGTKAVECSSNSDNQAYKVISSVTSDIFTFSLRKTVTNNGQVRIDLQQNSTSIFSVVLDYDGKIRFYRNSGSDVLANYSANTWYTIEVQVNGGQARVRVKDGTWTSYRNPANAYTNINRIRMNYACSSTSERGYWDEIYVGETSDTSNFFLLF